MNTAAKARATYHHVVVGHKNRGHPGNGVEVITLNAANDATLHEAPTAEHTTAKSIVMFLAAPWIGLGYVIAMPAIGGYLLAKLALEACAKFHPATYGIIRKVALTLKNIGLFFFAPLVALAYVIALPLVGFYVLAKLAMKAHGPEVC